MEKNSINLEELSKIIQGKGCEATVQEVLKNNIKKNAICVQFDDSPISPTLYEEILADFAEDCSSMEELADRCIEFTRTSIDLCPDISFVNERDYILEHASLGICKTDWNEELLTETPHESLPGTDLCVYPRISLPDSSLRVTYSLMKSQSLTSEEVLAAAKANTMQQGFVCESMADILHIPQPDSVPGMLVLSNEERFWGAAVLANKEALDAAREKLDTDRILILPSSCHEAIAIPYQDGPDLNDLKNMIEEINTMEVAEDQRLSNEPYVYDNSGLRLAIPQQVQIHSARRGR